MKRTGKIYAAAAICIGLGIALTGGGILAGGWPGMAVGREGIRMADDFYKEAHRLEKTELEEFSSADIRINSGNFYILPSDGFYLEYCLSGTGQKPSYTVEDNKFVFEETADFEFYIMNFEIGRPQEEYYMKLYVPEDIYLDALRLKGSSGNAFMDKLSAGNIDVELSYGNLEAGEIQAEEMKLSLGSGAVDFERLLTKENLDIRLESGNLTGEELLAGTFAIDNTYGNIKVKEAEAKKAEFSLNSGNLTCEELAVTEDLSIRLESGELKTEKLSAQTFVIDSTYGNLTFGELEAEKAEISANTGNVKAETCSGGSFLMTAESGNINIGEGIFVDGSFSLTYGNLKLLNLSSENMNVRTDSGNVYLELSGEPSEYSMNLRTQYGTIEAPEMGNFSSEDGEKSFSVQGSSERQIEVSCESGNISIEQKK